MKLIRLVVPAIASLGLMVAGASTAFAAPAPPPAGCVDSGQGTLTCTTTQAVVTTSQTDPLYTANNLFDFPATYQLLDGSIAGTPTPYTVQEACQVSGFPPQDTVGTATGLVLDVTTTTQETTTTVEKKNGRVLSTSTSLGSPTTSLSYASGTISCDEG